MQGIVFKYDIEKNIGCILGEDGHFYNFNLIEVLSDDLNGLDSVEFKAQKSKREAFSIQKIPENKIEKHIIPNNVIFDQLHQTHWDVYRFQENNSKDFTVSLVDEQSVHGYYNRIKKTEQTAKNLNFNSLPNTYFNFTASSVVLDQRIGNNRQFQGSVSMKSNYALIGKKSILGTVINKKLKKNKRVEKKEKIESNNHTSGNYYFLFIVLFVLAIFSFLHVDADNFSSFLTVAIPVCILFALTFKKQRKTFYKYKDGFDINIEDFKDDISISIKDKILMDSKYFKSKNVEYEIEEMDFELDSKRLNFICIKKEEDVKEYLDLLSSKYKIYTFMKFKNYDYLYLPVFSEESDKKGFKELVEVYELNHQANIKCNMRNILKLDDLTLRMNQTVDIVLEEITNNTKEFTLFKY